MSAVKAQRHVRVVLALVSLMEAVGYRIALLYPDGKPENQETAT